MISWFSFFIMGTLAKINSCLLLTGKSNFYFFFFFFLSPPSVSKEGKWSLTDRFVMLVFIFLQDHILYLLSHVCIHGS